LKARRTDDWKSMKHHVNNDNSGRKSRYSELLPVTTVDAMNGVVKWNVYKIKQFIYTVRGIYYHSNTHFKEKYISLQPKS